MKRCLRNLGVLPLSLGLLACNSGGGQSAAVDAPPATDPTGTISQPLVPVAASPSGKEYFKISQRTDDASYLSKPSFISGGVSFRDPSTKRVTLSALDGAVNHVTGSTSLNADPISILNKIQDADGIRGGVFDDGNGNVLRRNPNLDTSAYDYVFAYSGDVKSGGKTYAASYYGGVATAQTDVPTSGSAMYSGIAGGTISDHVTNSTTNIKGQASINVGFGSGTVQANITGLSGKNTSGQSVSTPFDEIRMTNLSLFRSGQFVGERGLTTLPNGTTVETIELHKNNQKVIGTDVTFSASGHVAGFDTSKNIPDEVVGVVGYNSNEFSAEVGFVGD